MINVLSIATAGYLSKYKWPLSMATDGYLSVYAIIVIDVGGIGVGKMEIRDIVKGEEGLEERIEAQQQDDSEVLLIIQIFMMTWD